MALNRLWRAVKDGMTEDRLGALSSFMLGLTPRGVVLLVILSIIGMLGYAVWEQRVNLLPVYLGSTAALVGTGVAITMVLSGLIVMDLYGRLEDRAEAAMKKHAESLQMQINLQAATAGEQAVRIVALTLEHVTCQARLAELAMSVAAIKGHA